MNVPVPTPMTKKKSSETDALNFKKTGKSIQYMYYSFYKYLSTNK